MMVRKVLTMIKKVGAFVHHEFFLIISLFIGFHARKTKNVDDISTFFYK